VVSGSREHFQAANGIDAGTCPVLITAPVERLVQRLAARGREDEEAVRARLQRGAEQAVADARLVTIVNDGALDEAAGKFVSLLATLRSAQAARRRA
jgi:ribose 1,5-bisphosphokinase